MGDLKCPKCGSGNVARERRPNGNDRCGDCSCVWPSCASGEAFLPKDKPRTNAWWGLQHFQHPSDSLVITRARPPMFLNCYELKEFREVIDEPFPEAEFDHWGSEHRESTGRWPDSLDCAKWAWARRGK